MAHASRGKKIVGEFLLIVVGVLTALAAESWAERQREHATGDTYLEQLRSDIEVNDSLLASAIAWQELSVQAVEAVTASHRDGTPISADSMGVLIGEKHLLNPARVQLVMGTVSALVGAGDLKLLEDPQVRFALLNYASLMDRLQVDLTRHRQPLNDYGADIIAFWRADTRFEDGMGTSLGRWMSGRQDSRVLEAIAHIWLDGANMLAILRNMASATDALASSIEGAGT